jgi:uncharacterized repeat protein (TIGR01451 family)
MKQRHAVAIALAAVLLACLGLVGATLALSQPATPSIGWWILGSGGAAASGGTVSMHDTLGEPVIGLSSGGSVSLGAGYWYGALLPDLSITKGVDNHSPKPGKPITYTIVISSSGDGNATGAVLSDTLPAELTFAGPVGLDPPSAGTTGTPPLLVTGATVAASQSITATFAVTVNTCLSTGTLITNTAALTSTELTTPITASVAITVANARPKLGSVTPFTGSGPISVTTYLTTTWKDDNCWQDLKHCFFHIGDSPSIAGNVTLLYNAVKNKLWIRRDDGGMWTGGCLLGDASTMENSQAIVHCNLTTMQGSGDTLSVTWAIDFKAGYTGAKKLGLKCKDRSKAKAKGAWKGTWTIE